jgi:hypothetical protein
VRAVVSDVLTRWSELFALSSVRDTHPLVLVDEGLGPVATAATAVREAGRP